MNSKQLSVGKVTSTTAFRVDEKALAKAVKHLGIKKPVTVKFVGGTRRQGCHMMRWNDHVIHLNRAAGAGSAGRTLWHELRHAEQAERLGRDEFNEQYRKEQASRGYRRNKFEREARETEDMNDSLPLCLAVSADDTVQAEGGKRFRIEVLNGRGRYGRYGMRATQASAERFIMSRPLSQQRFYRVVDIATNDVLFTGPRYAPGTVIADQFVVAS